MHAVWPFINVRGRRVHACGGGDSRAGKDMIRADHGRGEQNRAGQGMGREGKTGES